MIDRIRTWKQARGSSGRRRRITRVIAAGLSTIMMAVVLSACAATPTNILTDGGGPDGTVYLNWADVSGNGFSCTFAGYAVYMSTTPGGEDTTGTPLGAVTVNGQLVTNATRIGDGSYSYTVTGLQPGTTYYFVILTIGTTASGSTCIASPSTEVTATPIGQPNGGVQVTLSWYSTADLDLHVVEPNGTEIYYGNTTDPSTGGTYALDANSDCTANVSNTPKETVTWANPPPSGTYTIKAVYYTGCNSDTGPQGFNVTVYRGGTVFFNDLGTLNSPGDEQDFTFSL